MVSVSLAADAKAQYETDETNDDIFHHTGP